MHLGFCTSARFLAFAKSAAFPELSVLVLVEQKFGKPCEEPLLAAHDQEELDLMAKEKAEIEAKRLAEEERLERERHLHEVIYFFP